MDSSKARCVVDPYDLSKFVNAVKSAYRISHKSALWPDDIKYALKYRVPFGDHNFSDAIAGAWRICDSSALTNFCTNASKGVGYPNHTIMQTMNLPNCISISSYALSNFNALRVISLPNLSEVGQYAFYNAGADVGDTYTFLDNCTVIDSYAFCSAKIQSVSVPLCSKIDFSAFIYADLSMFYGPAVTSLAVNAFDSCPHLSAIHLPNLVIKSTDAGIYFSATPALITVSASQMDITKLSVSLFSTCKHLLTGMYTWNEEKWNQLVAHNILNTLSIHFYSTTGSNFNVKMFSEITPLMTAIMEGSQPFNISTYGQGIAMSEKNWIQLSLSCPLSLPCISHASNNALLYSCNMQNLTFYDTSGDLSIYQGYDINSPLVAYGAYNTIVFGGAGSQVSFSGNVLKGVTANTMYLEFPNVSEMKAIKLTTFKQCRISYICVPRSQYSMYQFYGWDAIAGYTGGSLISE